MLKNNKIKILCLLIIGIVFLYIYGPIAFMKDGLVTRQSVNSFDELYELGPARRHKCENGTRIYIVYFGWSAPKVKKEIVYQKNEGTQKQIVDVDTQKIIPGLYYVSWDTKSTVFPISESRSCSSSSTCHFKKLSSADSGSSNNRISGCDAIMRASATRCF